MSKGLREADLLYYKVQYKKGDVIFITNVLSYLFTTLAFRLIIPAMLTMMLSVRSTWAIGIVVFKILNFFRQPIARSTWVLTCNLSRYVNIFGSHSLFPSCKCGYAKYCSSCYQFLLNQENSIS